MARDLKVTVLLREEPYQLEGQLQRWLANQGGVEVGFISRSEHLVGQTQYLTVSVFYTEPSDRERELQAQMRESAR